MKRSSLSVDLNSDNEEQFDIVSSPEVNFSFLNCYLNVFIFSLKH